MDAMSERRLVENELFFKRPNEKLAKDLVELGNIAKEDNQDQWYPEADEPFSFFCECSSKKCRERIEIKAEQYLKEHKNSNQFIVLPGHNIPSIERIVRSEPDYLVVEKFVSPPPSIKHGKKINSN